MQNRYTKKNPTTKHSASAKQNTPSKHKPSHNTARQKNLSKPEVISSRKFPKFPKLTKSLAGLLIGVTVVGCSIFSITFFEFNFDNSVTNVHNNTANIDNSANVINYITNNVIDQFQTSFHIDEAGNRLYIVHPSRYDSLRSVEIEVVDGQSTIVNFIGD